MKSGKSQYAPRTQEHSKQVTIISLLSQVTNQGTKVKSIVQGHKRQKEANEAWAVGSVPQLYTLPKTFCLLNFLFVFCNPFLKESNKIWMWMQR